MACQAVKKSGRGKWLFSLIRVVWSAYVPLRRDSLHGFAVYVLSAHGLPSRKKIRQGLLPDF
jgi:hypothetical protein